MQKNKQEMLNDDIVYLRALEPEDLEVLYKWENDTRLWIHGNSLSPYSKLALRQYISDAQAQDIYQAKQLRLMITLKSNDETIGTVDLYDFDIRNSKAGVGILIDEKWRNLNYAYKVLEIIKVYVFTFLKLHQLYAYIAIDNISSIKLFEKAEFEKSGILKDWISNNSTYQNVYVYQITNNNE